MHARLLTCVAVVLFVGAVRAVTVTSDGTWGSIVAALASVTPGDPDVIVPAGTYAYSGGTVSQFGMTGATGTKLIADGYVVIQVSGFGVSDNWFQFSAGEQNDYIIGIVFDGASKAVAAPILVVGDGASPTLMNVVFRNAQGQAGSYISASSPTTSSLITLLGCQFINMQTSAMLSASNNVVVYIKDTLATDCKVVANSAFFIANDLLAVTLVNVTVIRLTSNVDYPQPGLYRYSWSTVYISNRYHATNLTIFNSTFDSSGVITTYNQYNNFMPRVLIDGSTFKNGQCGALMITRSYLTVTNSVFLNNSVSPVGSWNTGNLRVDCCYGTIEFTNVVIANNTARGVGGGFYLTNSPGATLRMTFVQISGNAASTQGGGFMAELQQTVLYLNHSLITDNVIPIVDTSVLPSDPQFGGAGMYLDCGGGHRTHRFNNVTIARNIVSNSASYVSGSEQGYGGGIGICSFCSLDSSAGRSYIVGNSATVGAGLFIRHQSLGFQTGAVSNISNFEIANNTALGTANSRSGGGAAISFTKPEGCRFIDVTFRNNIADYLGGGFLVSYYGSQSVGARLYFSNCTFDGNKIRGPVPTGTPGGLGYSSDYAIPTIMNKVTFKNHVGATQDQVPLRCSGCDVKLYNTSFFNNINTAGYPGNLRCISGSIGGAGVTSEGNTIGANNLTADMANCFGCNPDPATRLAPSQCLPIDDSPCDFTCKPGYVPNPTKSLCGQQCTGNSCPPLSGSHAIINCVPDGFASGTQCSIDCGLGYELSKSDISSITCDGGVWTPDLPMNFTTQVCRASACPLIGSAGAGGGGDNSDLLIVFPTNPIRTGDTANISCAIGYSLSGPKQISCNAPTSQGSMPQLSIDSNTLLSCTLASCDLTRTPYVSASLGCSTDYPVPVGVSCNLSCSAGYMNAGDAIVTSPCVGHDTGGSTIGVFDPAPSCQACVTSTYAGLGATECTRCINGVTDQPLSTSPEQCMCLRDYYTRDPSLGACDSCPTGGFCSGRHELPVAANGFFEINGAYIQCVPSVACIGNSSCAPGYTDSLCGKCETNYYKLNTFCVPCPGDAEARLWTAVVVSAVLVVVLIFVAQPRSGDTSKAFAAPTIFFSYAQVTSVIGDLRFPWPPIVRKMFDFFSSFNLNIELTNPDCVVTTSFHDKLQVQLIMPLVVLGIYAICAAVTGTYVYFKTRKGSKKFMKSRLLRLSINFVAAYLLFLTIAYLFLARSSFAVFSCVKLNDGSIAISSSPIDKCYTPAWNRSVGWSIFGIIAYVIGIPIALMVLFPVIRYYHSSEAAAFHPLANFYVKKYVRATWYWDVVVIVRKLLIVILAVFLVSDPILQSAACCVILLLAGVATIGVRPFSWYFHDAIELASLLASLIVLFAGFVFQTPGLSDASRDAVAIAVLVIVIVCGIIIGICFLIELQQRFSWYMSHLNNNSCVQTMRGGKGPITCLAIAGEEILAGTEQGSVLVFGLARPKMPKTRRFVRSKMDTILSSHAYTGHTDAVTGIAAIDAGRYAVTCSLDATIRMWDVTGDGAVAEFAQPAPIYCMSHDASRRLLAVGDKEGKVRVLRLSEGAAVSSGSDSEVAGGGHELKKWSEFQAFTKGAVRCVLIHNDFVYAGGADGVVKEYHIESGTPYATFTFVNDPITALACDGGQLFVGSNGALMWSVDIEDHTTTHTTYSGHQGAIASIFVDAKAGRVFTASKDWSMNIYDIKTTRILQTLTGHRISINALVRHEKHYFTASDDGTIRRWIYNEAWDQSNDSWMRRLRNWCCNVKEEHVDVELMSALRPKNLETGSTATVSSDSDTS